VEKLQTALEAFMKDHRAVAKADNALWAERTEGLTAEEVEEISGCGCGDCVKAGSFSAVSKGCHG
jgi:hypothetical protein